MKTQSIDLFPIPFFRGIDALSKEQLSDIIKFIETSPDHYFKYHPAFGDPENSKSSFLSQPDVLTYFDENIPSCKGLKQSIQRVVDSYCRHFGIEEVVICNSWVNVQSKGAETTRHLHGRVAILAATIYIRKCDDTYFYTPSPFSQMIPRDFSRPTTKYTTDPQKINCNDGDMLLFPAWVSHASKPHMGDEDRIVLSFNCSLKNV